MNKQTQNPIKYVVYCADYQPIFPSNDQQEEYLIGKAEFEELNVVGIFKEKHSKTDQFSRLLKLAKQNEIQGILIWDLSILPKSDVLESMIKNNSIVSIKSFIDL